MQLNIFSCSAWLSASAAMCLFNPVSSAVDVHPIKPAVEMQAKPLPLSAVRLTGGPLKRAQDLDAEYLLSLEPDRMLSHYRRLAGLEPKAPGYGGWDAGGRQLTGHIAGHYLSAVSLMWAATGDVRFKDRADYIVAQLAEVQQANGNGFAGALENVQEEFAKVSKGEIRSGGFDLNGLWSPWYTLHKTFAGLRDAYRYTGNKLALEVELGFAEWAATILTPMSDRDVQRMLNTEFGGMNEVFVDLYTDTGDKRWLDMSFKFEHEAIIDPLKHEQDILAGKHGNTQVPKLIGSLDRYIATGDVSDGVAARFFWDRVVNHHSFATGGHGKDEYFGPPDRLSDFIDGRTAESCNVYNMLKLTRELFALEPSPEYAAFMERALFNHVLGSIDPKDGRTCYMVPVGQGVRREYSDMQHSFTCCVGSGMESHALHGDGIYYTADDQLWITFFAPSTAYWEQAGVRLRTETDFPAGESVVIHIDADSPTEWTLAVRRPAWAGEGFSASVNDETIGEMPEPGSFVEIKRTWETGDEVRLTLPKKLHLEPTPDNENRVALMWGPLVLAGDLGPAGERRRGRGNRRSSVGDIPVFVTDGAPVQEWLKPEEADEPGHFATVGVGRERDLEFTPFYELHNRVYGAYWDLYTTEGWEQRAAQIAAERERLRKLEAVTVGFVRPGNMQSERDFAYQGDQAWPIHAGDRSGRYGRGWLSFEMPVESGKPTSLVVTYRGGHLRRPADFSISVDGAPLANVQLEQDLPAEFYDKVYPLPVESVTDKQKVTVRFEAKEDASIGPLFGVRTIRGHSSPE